MTGQDFMSDGAQRVNDILTAAGLARQRANIARPLAPESELVRPTCRGAGSMSANVNAHYLHYGGISGLRLSTT